MSEIYSNEICYHCKEPIKTKTCAETVFGTHICWKCARKWKNFWKR